LRIEKTRVSLNEKAVLDFFEERGRRYDEEKPLVSVLYQDQDPELAVRRDRHEIGTVFPLLPLDRQTRVLDIGCGIGRWADAIADKVAAYTGVDFSPKLIEIARNRQRCSSSHFFVGSADEIEKPEIVETGPFDVVIIAGVLIYLNDERLEACLSSLSRICSPTATIYVREPLAMQDRLTLKDIWSDELQQGYSSIYRTASELDLHFSRTLYPNGFGTADFQELYADQSLNNRSETRQHFTLIKRGL
jgi:2-polyprenyl-3-methyl-5-hydroxy-6-metoxy-1,4-benzoquinol methylase